MAKKTSQKRLRSKPKRTSRAAKSAGHRKSKPSGTKRGATKKKATKRKAVKKKPTKKKTAAKRRAATKSRTAVKKRPKRKAVKKKVTKRKAVKKKVAKKRATKRKTAKRTAAKAQATAKAPAKRKTTAKAAAKKSATAETKAPAKRSSTRRTYEVPPQVQAPKLTRAQILEFKAMIESERDALLEILSRLGQSDEESGTQDKPNRFGNHMADMASDSQLFETQLVQSGMEMDRLRQIDEALERLSSRRYGVCERCGANIRYERLRAKPFARYCIVCREHFERESLRRSR